MQKEENLDRKIDNLEKKEQEIEKKENDLDERQKELDKIKEQQLDELFKISRLTEDEAKNFIQTCEELEHVLEMLDDTTLAWQKKSDLFS